jgi:hypothetical protein
MRKHKSSTVVQLNLLLKKANELRDARIDAAIVEWTEIVNNPDEVDFNDLDRRLSEARQGGFPPEPRWRREVQHERRSLAPDAKGNFTW